MKKNKRTPKEISINNAADDNNKISQTKGEKGKKHKSRRDSEAFPVDLDGSMKDLFQKAAANKKLMNKAIVIEAPLTLSMTNCHSSITIATVFINTIHIDLLKRLFKEK